MPDETETLKISVEMTVNKGTDPEAIADALLDYLCDSDPGDVPGVRSFDNTEWR